MYGKKPCDFDVKRLETAPLSVGNEEFPIIL